MRTLLTYTLLVGAPLLGLMAILHFGAALQAPPKLDGRWRIDETETLLVVEQSGRFLRGRAAGERFDATIDQEDDALILRVERGRCAGWRGALLERPGGWSLRVITSGCLDDADLGRSLALIPAD